MSSRLLAGALALLGLHVVCVRPALAAGYQLGRAARLGSAYDARPSVAVSAAGRTVAAWERRARGRRGEDYGPIVARLGAVGRGWAVTQTLTREGQDPLVAVGANGTAAVVWGRPEPNGDSMVVSVASGRGRFSRAIRVGRSKPTSRANGFVTPVGIEVQPDGRVVVVWVRTLAYALLPLESAVEYATLSASGASLHVGRIGATDTETEGRGVSVAQSESGEVLVATETSAGSGEAIAVAGLPEGAPSFTTPQRLAVPDEVIDSFQLSAGAGGAILAVALPSSDVSAGSASSSEAWVSRLEPQNVFEALEPVMPPPALEGLSWQSWEMAAALPADGATVVAWLAEGTSEVEEEKLVNGDEQEQRLLVAVRPSDSATGEYVLASPSMTSHGRSLAGTLVVVAGGTAMVVWARKAGHCTRALYAAVRPAAGVFAAAVRLAPRFHLACQAGGPEMSAVGAGRYAILGWIQEGTTRAVTLTE